MFSFLKEYAPFFEWIGILSLLTFIGSLVAVPWIIGKLPADYFIQHRKKVAERHEQHPLAAKIIFISRNGIGFVFFLAGVVMLVLPGQGIITILIGISFMDFPGKHALVDYLVRRPRVIRILNWIRNRKKRPPFAF